VRLALGLFVALLAPIAAMPALGCGGCPRAGRTTSGENESEQFVASHETPDHTVVIEDAFVIRQAGDPIDLPPLHPDQVVAVVVAGSPDLRRCYESALTEHPAAAGRIVLQIHVRADGHVIDADVVESEIDDGMLTDCFGRRARHWHFPASAHDVTLRYPFDLTPEPLAETAPSAVAPPEDAEGAPGN
jgi:hypothetical protein